MENPVIIEYELIDIEFNVGYELPEETSFIVSEDVPSDKKSEDNAIEYDADGVPMGRTKEESLIRRKLIHDYIQNWRSVHSDNPRVYNDDLKDYIKVNQLFLLESVAHAAYSYLSTKAVMAMDDVMTKARKIGETKVKEGDRNQKPFQQMIVLLYKDNYLGNVKMTVGIRKTTKEKVEYSITVPPPGTPFIVNDARNSSKTKGNKRKKRSH